MDRLRRNRPLCLRDEWLDESPLIASSITPVNITQHAREIGQLWSDEEITSQGTGMGGGMGGRTGIRSVVCHNQLTCAVGGLNKNINFRLEIDADRY